MRQSRSAKPSAAARAAARVLLAPPPEFQAVMSLLRQNTKLLEQTADTLDRLVVVMAATKLFSDSLQKVPELQKKTTKPRTK